MDDIDDVSQGAFGSSPSNEYKKADNESTEASNLSIEGKPPLTAPNGQPNAPYKPRAYRSRGPMVQDITTRFTEAASGVQI